MCSMITSSASLSALTYALGTSPWHAGTFQIRETTRINLPDVISSTAENVYV
ncbi:hypothetical protein PF008_g2035 [Phytophthora fragariae]|uniref:Uncharacterized protein n=1 Tax=Phytophthora fragariae TaxID=53985 RepID=A0A6G0SID3_9STRA|nr:hypothetical protein PF008_g2035 [Phytophthora fragariae]